MPPATELTPDAALDRWTTMTRTLEALSATDEVEATGHCRSTREVAEVARNGVTYFFDTDARQLARRVAATRPDVVHIHGLGFTRLTLAIRGAVGRSVPILLQHHGELPPTRLRSKLAQRWCGRFVTGYLFTGASGQAGPFRQAGLIRSSAAVHEVLEAASHLDEAATSSPVDLAGDPSVLWVGRLIASKDPVCAVQAVAEARSLGSQAELHLVATDRSMESDVRRAITALGLDDVVHLHEPVAHVEMTRWYRSADVYLSTSHREGSNYSLIEALQHGCRPVVTEIASHAAIVGELAPRFAVRDVSRAAALIATDAPSRHTVARHSAEHLSWSSVAAQLTRSYRQSLRA
jgi:glycosyltransferase involved in cell wall biosynthesis